MKQKFIGLFIFIASIQSGFTQTNGSTSTSSSGSGGYCECTSILCAVKKHCSVKGYSCTCTCTITICTCTPCSTSERIVVGDIEVNDTHIQNRRELIFILNGFNSPEGDGCALLINQTFNALCVEKNIDNYFTKGNLAEQSLSNLPNHHKNTINNWLASKGSSIRY